MKSSGSNNGDQNNNSASESKQLVQRINIKETPFEAVKFDQKWYLIMGKYRLTEGLNAFEDVENEAFNTSWFRIMQIVQIMIDEDRAKHDAKTKEYADKLGAMYSQPPQN